MELLQELTQLKADNTAALALLEEAKTAKATFDSQLEAKETALAEQEALVIAANALVAAKEKALTEQAEALAAVQAELAQAKADQKTVAEQAVEIVASQGIAPIASKTEEQDAPATKAEAMALYAEAKTPSAKAEIYKQYKAVLLGR